MGQERAVETSQAVYFVTAAISGLAVALLSVLTVYLLSGRRGWNAFGSSALSTAVFSISTVVLHVGCVVVAAIVAGQMRTNQ